MSAIYFAISEYVCARLATVNGFASWQRWGPDLRPPSLPCCMLLSCPPVERRRLPGFLAGFVASSFTLGRTIMSYFWGWAADRFGRKPVMIWSMFSMAVVSVIFGVSDNFTWALTSR